MLPELAVVVAEALVNEAVPKLGNGYNPDAVCASPPGASTIHSAELRTAFPPWVCVNDLPVVVSAIVTVNLLVLVE